MLRTLMKMVLVLVILSMIFCRFRHCLFCSGLGVNDLAVFHIVFSNDSHLCLSSYPLQKKTNIMFISVTHM